MEFGHASKPCDMTDWYDRKWYECANQTDAFIFTLSSSTARELQYTPTFTYHGYRFVELSATQILPDGSEAPLSGSAATRIFDMASLIAHRTNTAVRHLGVFEVSQPPTAGPSAVKAAATIAGIFACWSSEKRQELAKSQRVGGSAVVGYVGGCRTAVIAAPPDRRIPLGTVFILQ